MALVKCKECGDNVSSKAKACPKCGAKVPKKTSLFTWLAFVSIIFVVYVASQSPTSTGGSIGSSGSSTSKVVKKLPPPRPSWITSTSKDKMTGKYSTYAHSPTAYPSRRMEFPYSNVNSWMGVGCENEKEWVYFGFNSAPNLAKDETKDGYNLIRTRIKWNGEVGNVLLTQNWGAEFIHFIDDATAISKISASNTVLLELQWHGEQPTYFEYSLNGSSKAIAEIRARCSSNK